MDEHTPNIVSACIDIGIEHSGSAFLLKHHFVDKTDMLGRIAMIKWESKGYLTNMYTPTTILLDPQGKFHSFGYEAEEFYTELREDCEQNDWYYFPRFAAAIYDHTGSYKDMKLGDLQCRNVAASTLFAHAIRYMKDLFLHRVCKSSLLQMDDIKWVLAIPNVSNDAIEDFIRNAATEAGLPGDEVCVVRDHTAVTLYTKFSTKNWFHHGKKYMILDWKQDRFEATVFEVVSEDSLREISHTTDSTLGIYRIEKEIYKILTDILGIEVLKKFKAKYQWDADCFKSDIENKLECENFRLHYVTIKMPVTLHKLYEEEYEEDMEAAVQRSRYSGKIRTRGRDKISFTAEYFSGILLHVIDEICDRIVETLKKPECNDTDLFIFIGTAEQTLCTRLKERFTVDRVFFLRQRKEASILGGALLGHCYSKLTVVERLKETDKKQQGDVWIPEYLSLQEDTKHSLDAWKKSIGNCNVHDIRRIMDTVTKGYGNIQVDEPSTEPVRVLEDDFPGHGTDGKRLSDTGVTPVATSFAGVRLRVHGTHRACHHQIWDVTMRNACQVQMVVTTAAGVAHVGKLDEMCIKYNLLDSQKSSPSGRPSEKKTTNTLEDVTLECRQLKIENQRLERELSEQIALNMSSEKTVKALEAKIKAVEEEKASWMVSRIEGAQVAVTPTYSDLCEEIRPTKIAEKFQDLYENEWTDALEELMEKGLSEHDAIEALRNILLEANTFSQDQVEKLTDLTNYFNETIVGKKIPPPHKPSLQIPPRCKNLTKGVLKEAATQLVSMIKGEFMKTQQSQTQNIGPATNAFCQKCSEVTWYMKVLTPSVVLDDLPAQKSKIDLDSYMLYSKHGRTVDFVVWPACKLDEEDCLLAKGIVEALPS